MQIDFFFFNNFIQIKTESFIDNEAPHVTSTYWDFVLAVLE